MPQLGYELRHIDDGRKFALLIGFTDFLENGWDRIRARAAAEFDCRRDDVDTEEGDDGEEYLTVGGKRVGFIAQVLR